MKTSGFTTISEEKQTIRERERKIGTEYFTVLGREDFKDEDNLPRLNEEDEKRICAKRVDGKNYILRNNKGNFLNPNDPYEMPNINQSRNGINLWKFVEVNDAVFGSYLKFLKTMNQSYLRHAERER